MLGNLIGSGLMGIKVLRVVEWALEFFQVDSLEAFVKVGLIEVLGAIKILLEDLMARQVEILGLVGEAN